MAVPEFGTPVDEIPEFGTPVDAVPEFGTPVEDEEDRPVVPTEDPYGGKPVPVGVGKMALSAGTEITGSLLGELAAVGMRSANPRIKGAATAIRFISGAASSAAAQKIEGKDFDDMSIGRLLAAGAVNTMFTTRKFSTTPKRDFLQQGAMMGATESAISSLIDEGKINPVDIAVSTGVGGLVGLGFGKVDEKFGNITQRLTGKTSTEIDDMIRNNELTNEDLGVMLKTVAGREVSDVEIERARIKIDREFMAREQALEVGGSFKEMLQKGMNYVVPSKAIGPAAREDYFQFADNLRRAEAISTRLKKNIDNLVSNSPNLRDDISRFLDGGEMSEELGKQALSGDLRALRDLEIETMRGLHDAIKDSDTIRFLPKEKQEMLLGRMQESISKGVRVYDSAQYRAFTDVKFSTKVKEAEVLEEIEDTLLRDIDPDDEKAVKAAKKQAEKHLAHIKSMRKAGEGGKRSRQKELISALPGRFEIEIEGHMPGPKEREFLGEVTAQTMAPGEKARFAIRDNIKHKAYIDSDKAIIKSLKDTGQIAFEQLPGYTPLRLKSTSGKDLDGRQMYIPYYTNEAVQKLYETNLREVDTENAAAVVQQLYGSAVGASKAVKVVLNPPSYMVNLVGGAIAAAGNGVVPTFGKRGTFKDYKKGAKLAMTELHGLYNYTSKKVGGKIGDPNVRKRVIDEVNEMYEYGIGQGSIAANEVSAAINNGKIGDLTEKALSAAGKLYSISDTATRFTIWKKNIRDFTDILKVNGVDVSDDQIKRMAASVTNDTYQNYERTSRFAKYLSKVGVMPPFVTFSMEFVRNTANQVNIIRKMIDGDAFAKTYGFELNEAARKALSDEGKRRAGYLAGAFALAAAAPAFMGAVAIGVAGKEVGENVPSEDMEDYRFFLPSYARDKDIAATFNKATKDGTFTLTSYLFPHAVITEKFAGMLNQAYKVGDDERAVRDGLRALFTEFVGEGTFVNQSLFRAIDNRDFRGEKISEREGAKLLVDKLAFFGAETFNPGFVREGEKLVESLQGRGDFSTKEVILRQLGLRFQKVNFSEMAKFRVQDFSERYSAARGKYSSAAKYGDLSQAQLEQTYRNSVQEAGIAFSRVQEAYNRLDTFGYSTDEKIEILRGGNVKSSDIFRIVRGLPFKEFPRGLNLSIGEEYSEKFKNMPEEDIRKEIRSMIGGSDADRIKASRFRTEMRRRYNDERRARTAEDKLLMNMSIAERAEILKEMGADKDRTLLNDYKRKGIVNKDVSMLLK